MPKVLVISVKAGAGHLKAAEAVEAAFRKYRPRIEVQNIDLLDYSTELIKYIYGKMYLDVVKSIPELYAYSYKHHETAKKIIKPRLLIDQFNFGHFFGLVEDFNPDLIIATHFVPGALLENYRRKKKKKFLITTVITDYEYHPLWLVPNIDLYFTATEEVKNSLIFYGVQSEGIVVSGIPIHPKFSEPKPKKELLARYGLDSQLPVILVSAGSFGVTPLGEVISNFGAIQDEFQLMVVCGNNSELRKDLEKKQKSERRLKKVFGFVDFMDELMAMSDLLITKPGGITASESMALGVPMIFIEPIPGQEEANADYMVEQGAGVRARNLPVLIHKLGLLVKDSQKLADMSRRAKAISHPYAAKKIVEEAVNLL